MKNQNNLWTIKYLKKLFLFLNILVLLSCNSKPKTEQDQKPDLSNAPTEIKPPIIDIEKDFNNKKEFCLSDIADDIEYIKLEKTPDLLVGGGNSLWYLTKNYIIVYNQSRILQFDRNGKFIKEIGKQGRGPGEFIAIRGIRFNKSKDVFYVISNFNHTILKYDNITGNFLGSIPFDEKLGGTSNSFFHMLNDTFIAMPGPLARASPDYNLVEFIDTNGNVLSTKNSSIYSKEFKDKTLALNGSSQIWNFRGQLRLFEDFNDTIFNIENTDLKPAYVFNFGNYKGPFDIMSGTSDDRENYLTVRLFWETQDYLFFLSRYNNNGYCCQYDKSEGKFYRLTNPEGLFDAKIYNDVDGGLAIPFYPFYPVEYSYNEFVYPMDAIDLKQQLTSEYLENSEAKFPEKKEKLKKFMDELSIDDNPVLMLVKLKE